MNYAHLLTANFWKAVLTDPENVESVRQLIFELAITGKLVEQKSEEGNASKLLEEIRLSHTITVEQERSSEFIESSSLPRIPDNWTWTTLNQIGEINPRNSAEETMDAGFVPMTLISEKYSVSHEFEVKPWGSIKKGYTHIRNGDVVLAKITPCFENGKSAIIEGLPNGLGAGTTEIHVVRPIIVDPRFIQLFWKSPFFVMNGIPKMTGTAGQKRLPTDYFKNFPFPLPPIQEQQRIAERVQQLLTNCDELEINLISQANLSLQARKSAVDAISTAKTPKDLQIAWERIQNNWDVITGTPESITSLRQLLIDLAIQGQLFGRTEIGTHGYPVNWSINNFGSICDIEGGSQPPKSVFISEPREGYVQLFQIRDLGKNPIPVYIPTSLARSTSVEGEILIGRYGASVGKIFKAKTGAYNVALVKFIFPKDELNSDFIYWFLKSSRSQSLFTGMSRSAQAGFNKRDLSPLLIPIPTKDEQEEIVVKLNSLMAICDELDKSLISSNVFAEKFAQSAVAASA